jgi:hypothetical protein
MIQHSRDTEGLALKLAATRNLAVDVAVRCALEAALADRNGTKPTGRRTMTVEQMLAVGAEIAASPTFDPRTPNKIMDDLNEP